MERSAIRETRNAKKDHAFGALAAAIGIRFPPGSAQAHDIVSVKDGYGSGTIVIRTGERRLYYFVGAGEATRYPADVGRAGMRRIDAGADHAGSMYLPLMTVPDHCARVVVTR